MHKCISSRFLIGFVIIVVIIIILYFLMGKKERNIANPAVPSPAARACGCALQWVQRDRPGSSLLHRTGISAAELRVMLYRRRGLRHKPRPVIPLARGRTQNPSWLMIGWNRCHYRIQEDETEGDAARQEMQHWNSERALHSLYIHYSRLSLCTK